MLSGLGIEGRLGPHLIRGRPGSRRCDVPLHMRSHRPYSGVDPTHVGFRCRSTSMRAARCRHASPDEQKHHRTTGRVRMRGLASAPCRSTAVAQPGGSRRYRVRARQTTRSPEPRSSRSRSMECSRPPSRVPFSCSAASPAGWPARWSSERSHWWPYSCSPRRGRHGNPGRPQQVAAAGAGGAEAP